MARRRKSAEKPSPNETKAIPSPPPAVAGGLLLGDLQKAAEDGNLKAMQKVASPPPAAASDHELDVLVQQASQRAAEIREAEKHLTLRARFEDILRALRNMPALAGRPWPSATMAKNHLDNYLRTVAELTELIAHTGRANYLEQVKAGGEDLQKRYAARVLLHGVHKRWKDVRHMLVKLVLAWPGTGLTDVRIQVDRWLRLKLPREIFGDVLPPDSPSPDEAATRLTAAQQTPADTRGSDQKTPPLESFELIPAGFSYHGKVYNLSGAPLTMLRALKESRWGRLSRDQLRVALGVDNEYVGYPDAVIINTAKQLRKALRQAVKDAGLNQSDPLPSIGKGTDLAYELRLP
jgi:hypothetical protein